MLIFLLFLVISYLRIMCKAIMNIYKFDFLQIITRKKSLEEDSNFHLLSYLVQACTIHHREFIFKTHIIYFLYISYALLNHKCLLIQYNTYKLLT
ncbi:unnamed protein product [Blepharisma stoltei]|uniref:Secreted protein n=1 Tax=Blepharisma stoltei TaxID=1481888 RepID=A0AAU9IM37_9CILI|nr:unnamed protein product [Blepharisma stoltei]